MSKHTILLNYYKKYSSRGGEGPHGPIDYDDNVNQYTNDISYDESYKYLKEITDEINREVGDHWYSNARNNIFDSNTSEEAKKLLKYWKYNDEEGNLHLTIDSEDTFTLICMAFEYEFNELKNKNRLQDNNEYWDSLFKFIELTSCVEIAEPETSETIRLGRRLTIGIGNKIIRQFIPSLYRIENKSLIPEKVRNLMNDYKVDVIRTCAIRKGGRFNGISYNNYRGGNNETYINQYIKYKLKMIDLD
jgi:hypothetical protein